MYRALRTFWTLAAVGGAVAVGLLTHDAGFIVITFLGGLVVPRMLGLTGRAFGFGPFAGGWWGGPRGGLARASAAGAMGRGGWGGPCFAGGRGGWRQAQSWEEWHRQAHEPQPTPPAAGA
jgi:hypothetical protein